MTHIDLEELGFNTVAFDEHSFVSKTNEPNLWLEVFYCNKTKYLQIMRSEKGKLGETRRYTILETIDGDIENIKQLLT